MPSFSTNLTDDYHEQIPSNDKILREFVHVFDKIDDDNIIDYYDGVVYVAFLFLKNYYCYVHWVDTDLYLDRYCVFFIDKKQFKKSSINELLAEAKDDFIVNCMQNSKFIWIFDTDSMFYRAFSCSRKCLPKNSLPVFFKPPIDWYEND